MLKRNGQLCHRSVPDYAGRLTDAEFLAYNAVFSSVEEDFKQISTVADSLTEIERAFPRLLEASEGASNSFSEVVADQTGKQWAVISPLLKLRRTELLFCKRFSKGEPEFSLIQRLDPESLLAKAHGVWQWLMMSYDPRELLQGFIETERQVSLLYARDIEAITRETTKQSYPDLDPSRVIKAIAQRFANKFSTEEQVVPVQVRRRSEGVRV